MNLVSMNLVSNKTRGCVTLWALPFTLQKQYLQAKEELCKPQMQKYNLQKYPPKENQNPSRLYYNSIITNLKFQHKPKTIIFQ
jgi:hypothetical protein